VCGAGERTQRDVAYSNTGANRTKLDVFAPGTGEHLPVLVWIHGGGWRIGDKSNVQRKPAAFNQAGYVFVSINYRLHPTANFADQAGDVARAISWVKNHAPDFGGDPGRIFVMGHSAGAHLAALVGTDARYLESVGLKLSDLSGVILLDGAGYDIPRQVREAALPRIKELYTTVFSEDEAKQREASPITHVARGRNIPPFLILHVATRRDARAQSEALAARLRGAGVEARVIPAEGKTHMTINRELGMPGDRPTREVLQFLQEHATRKPAP
jgi:acetyl esterase/lipase